MYLSASNLNKSHICGYNLAVKLKHLLFLQAKYQAHEFRVLLQNTEPCSENIICKCKYFLLFTKLKIYSTSNIFSQLNLSNIFQTSKSTWFVNFIRTYIFFSPSDFSNSPNHFCFSTNRIAFVGYTNSTIFHWPNYLTSDCTSEHYLCLFSFTIPWPNKFIQSLALFQYRSFSKSHFP